MDNLTAEHKKALKDVAIVIICLFIRNWLTMNGDSWEVLIVSIFIPCYLGYAINGWLKIVNNKFVRQHVRISDNLTPMFTGLALILSLHLPFIVPIVGGETTVFLLIAGILMWYWGWFKALGLSKNLLQVIGIIALGLILHNRLWHNVIDPLGVNIEYSKYYQHFKS